MIQRNKGLTLLEIVLAVLIMSSGIILIMRFAPTILHVRSKMDEYTLSTFLAVQKMERLRGEILNDFDGEYNEGEAPFSSPYDKYRYSVLVDTNPDIKTVEVEVWHIDKPDSKVTLDTKIAKR